MKDSRKAFLIEKKKKLFLKKNQAAMQEILVVLSITGAFIFLISHYRRQLSTRSSACAKGCGTCSGSKTGQLLKDFESK